jgi:hypothetical protein
VTVITTPNMHGAFKLFYGLIEKSRVFPTASNNKYIRHSIVM